MEKSREFIACGLWVLATALMVFGSFDYPRQHTPAGFAWGVFAGVMAGTLTVWMVVERCCYRQEEDVTVEQIAQVVDALHDAKRDVAHLISPKS